MHQNNIQIYQHLHDFHEVKESNFKKLLVVISITTLTMAAEIIFGMILILWRCFPTGGIWEPMPAPWVLLFLLIL